MSVSSPELPDLPPEDLFPLLEPACHEALLLSGGAHPLSRYSFVGLDPFLVVSARGRRVVLEPRPTGSSRTLTADPFEILRSILDACRRPPRPDLPPFWAGGIGYMSYEMGRHLERLPAAAVDDLQLPELYYAFYRAVLSFDHLQGVYALYLLPPAGDGREPAEVLAGLRHRFARARRSSADPPAWRPNTLPVRIESPFSRDDYLHTVRRILDYIEEGDIYQANLSQRFHTAYNGDPYGLFHRLYRINPAPFFAYLGAGSFQVLSSSPERFLLVREGAIETRPIKGTLPRGSTPEEDRKIAEELLASEKNRAELAMITDLLRNDLGRVSAYGSVQVKDWAHLEAYTNVFHLVSVVQGELAAGKDRIDLLRAAFPGGSITGCPKIRAMEIIDELEPTVRSVYTGSIGYLGWDGSMDLNIAIRTILLKGQNLYIQVGGGIVYDSDPYAEYEETLHKAASMKEALLDTSRLPETMEPGRHAT